MGIEGTLPEVKPVYISRFDHNNISFFSIVLKRKDYLRIAGKLGAKNADEIPALYFAYDTTTKAIFEQFEVPEDCMLTLCPSGFADEIADHNLRRYLGLLEVDRVQLDTHLPPNLYKKAFDTAPKVIITHCQKLAERVAPSKTRKEVLHGWVDELPDVLKVSKKEWWKHYVEDILDTLEVSEMHHRALGRLKYFKKYLLHVLIGTCYFLSIQSENPYTILEEENDNRDDTN